jgi:hypothetical protein
MIVPICFLNIDNEGMILLTLLASILTLGERGDFMTSVNPKTYDHRHVTNAIDEGRNVEGESMHPWIGSIPTVR